MARMTTETELKLHDAETQLTLALNNHGDEAIVRSCVNSLISAGRSVTFVMQRESSDQPELSAWYEARMEALLASPDAPLVKFFNARRVYSIHRGVISPQRVTAQITEFRIDGKLQPASAGQTMTLLRFDDVAEYMPNDSGGVFRLCTKYLGLMRALVTEWLAKRSALQRLADSSK